jgi:hypothetical protein
MFLHSCCCRPFWDAWNEFEVRHGNEDTFKEMLRIKRCGSEVLHETRARGVLSWTPASSRVSTVSSQLVFWLKFHALMH